jgi:hypothetical protein
VISKKWLAMICGSIFWKTTSSPVRAGLVRAFHTQSQLIDKTRPYHFLVELALNF